MSHTVTFEFAWAPKSRYPDGIKSAPVVRRLLAELAGQYRGGVPWDALDAAAAEEGYGPLNVLAGLARLEKAGDVCLGPGGRTLLPLF